MKKNQIFHKFDERKDLKEYKANDTYTFSGKTINYFDVYYNPSKVDLSLFSISDIIVSLSSLERWNGHSAYGYTVSEHTKLMIDTFYSTNWQQLNEDIVDDVINYILLHDATEAYISDIPSPMKKLIPQIEILENNFMYLIWKKFTGQETIKKEVKKIVKNLDIESLNFEWDFFYSKKQNTNISKKERILDFCTLIKEECVFVDEILILKEIDELYSVFDKID